MVMSFDPASQWLGKKKFTALPDEDSAGFLPASLQSISAGLSHFDPSSQAHLPTPAANIATPGEAAQAGQTSPGALSAGLPFSAQVGLGTGAPGAGGSSAVVGNMLRASSVGPGGAGGPGGVGPAGMGGESGRADITFGERPGGIYGTGVHAAPMGPAARPGGFSVAELLDAISRGLPLDRFAGVREIGAGDRGLSGGGTDVGGGFDRGGPYGGDRESNYEGGGGRL